MSCINKSNRKPRCSSSMLGYGPPFSCAQIDKHTDAAPPWPGSPSTKKEACTNWVYTGYVDDDDDHVQCCQWSNSPPPPPPGSPSSPPPGSPSSPPMDICQAEEKVYKDCPGLKAIPGFRKSCDTETKKDLVEVNPTCSSQQISTMWNDWEKCCGKKSGLSTGALVGIICGSVAVLFLIGFVYFRSTRKGRRGKR